MRAQDATRTLTIKSLALVWTRRALFVAVLLAIGPITVASFDLAFNNSARPWTGAPTVSWQIFGTFMWGVDSIG